MRREFVSHLLMPVRARFSHPDTGIRFDGQQATPYPRTKKERQVQLESPHAVAESYSTKSQSSRRWDSNGGFFRLCVFPVPSLSNPSKGKKMKRFREQYCSGTTSKTIRGCIPLWRRGCL